MAESSLATGWRARIIPGSFRERKLVFGVALLMLALAVADQLSKQYVTAHFKLHESLPVIPGFFDLVLVHNYGVAFGMAQGWGIVILSFSALVFLGLIFFGRKLAEGCAERYWSIGLLLSGIIGNGCDRLFRTPPAVVDFLDFHWGNVYHWPAFNVADMAIVVGVGIYFISSFLRKPVTTPSDTAPGSSSAE